MCLTTKLPVKMANNLESFAKMARLLAFIQITSGCLLLCFGIADRLVYGGFTGFGYFGVWIGVWAGVFMAFSVTSALFGVMITIFYGIGLSQINNGLYHDGYKDSYNGDFHGKLAVLNVMLILGIVTFGIGIWAAICTCLMKPCCEQPQEEQRRYKLEDGYVVPQLSGGCPVVGLMQPGGGGATAQGSHQPLVLLPVSDAPWGQHVIVQTAQCEGMAIGTPQEQVQPHLMHMSPPNAISSRDSSPLLKNEEMEVKIY